MIHSPQLCSQQSSLCPASFSVSLLVSTLFYPCLSIKTLSLPYSSNCSGISLQSEGPLRRLHYALHLKKILSDLTRYFFFVGPSSKNSHHRPFRPLPHAALRSPSPYNPRPKKGENMSTLFSLGCVELMLRGTGVNSLRGARIQRLKPVIRQIADVKGKVFKGLYSNYFRVLRLSLLRGFTFEENLKGAALSVIPADHMGAYFNLRWSRNSPRTPVSQRQCPIWQTEWMKPLCCHTKSSYSCKGQPPFYDG